MAFKYGLLVFSCSRSFPVYCIICCSFSVGFSNGVVSLVACSAYIDIGSTLAIGAGGCKYGTACCNSGFTRTTGCNSSVGFSVFISDCRSKSFVCCNCSIYWSFADAC